MSDARKDSQKTRRPTSSPSVPPGWRFEAFQAERELRQLSSEIRDGRTCRWAMLVALLISIAALCIAFAALGRQTPTGECQQHASENIEEQPEQTRVAGMACDLARRHPSTGGHQSRLKWMIYPLAKPHKQHAQRAHLHDLIGNATRLDREAEQERYGPKRREGLVPGVYYERSEWVRHALSLPTTVWTGTGVAS